tara:strand:+ start:747 stop:3299 length:2553 start_codon:yes stop_codon:yes gene_type:complete
MYRASCNCLESAVQELKNFLSDLGALSSENLQAIEDAYAYIQATEIKTENLQKHSIYDVHEEWYFGPEDSHHNWHRLANYLEYTKNWTPDTIRSIDAESTEVVSLLANPLKDKFSYRGLVVGYVQSGKTANMTATIAKAVDAGYNFVIILAGLTNALRKQTQMRIEKDLVNSDRSRWHKLTSGKDEGDFRGLANGAFPRIAHGSANLAVLKKNVSPLKNLHQTLAHTPSVIKNDMRVLVIDDECDSASVNSGKSDEEKDITAINALIRKIAKEIPAVTYVGYTATPFANVLINPYPVEDGQLDDLYPKDFITSLAQPNGYFGAAQLFGRDPIDAENPDSSEEGLDMIRYIPPEELPLIDHKKAGISKEDFYPGIPDSLREAVIYFIMSSAERLRRKLPGHITMLVHTSVYTVLHTRVSKIILQWIESNKNSLINASGATGDLMKNIWSEESGRAGKPFESSIDHLRPFIKDVLDRLEYPVENGESDKENRIDYEDEDKIYLVVGGTVLSRGLTLEGLSVSYFIRSTNQYDTLLQMGRWFGYRRGYEDIPRIWMPEDIAIAFRDMANIEAEVRADIQQYIEQPGMTPMDFAVRIRQIPGMQITARNKMRNSQACDINFSGQHRQTFKFYTDEKNLLLNNWKAAADLISTAEKSGLRSASSRSHYVYHGVTAGLVKDFFNSYQVHKDHAELQPEFLINFIDKNWKNMESWNVVLFQPDKRNVKTSGKPLGIIPDPALVNRAKLGSGTDKTADIKALMSLMDVVTDCEEALPEGIPRKWQPVKKWRNERIKNPLLILYCIDKDSDSTSNNREKLNAADHVVGYGIVFPGDPSGSGRYVSVVLNPVSAEDEDDD